MKANAPEKIFICDYGSELGFEWHSESDWEHQGSNDIEYIRADAFIEKACEWIRNNSHNYANNALGKEYLANDFRNYMRGDKV